MKRIVLFSGGSACRTINLALCGNAHLTRVVPGWDSGGSSKIIREKVGLLAVGDLRQALMTMAHGEGRAGDVVKICNARLSRNLGMEVARSEFLFYSEGRHPLLERMHPGLRGAILNYLKTFASTVGSDFDFRNGSIGNFILAGACLAHNGDINTAVFVFRKLCSIVGDVWTSSLENDLFLTAMLKNGEGIEQQDAITKLPEGKARIGIADVQLSTTSNDRPKGECSRSGSPRKCRLDRIRTRELLHQSASAPANRRDRHRSVAGGLSSCLDRQYTAVPGNDGPDARRPSAGLFKPMASCG